MLTAFTARPIIELKPRDKSKIETILAHGDRILVGLNSGALRIYRLNETPDSSLSTLHNESSQTETLEDSAAPPKKAPAKATDLLREVERFSTRAIEQLAIIKQANTIVSLSNYHISLHDLQTYELIETLSRTRNATSFAVTSNIAKDPDTGIPEIISRLAVAVKRRLLLWSWHESELRAEVTEVTLSEAIRTVTWANAHKVVCGMNAGYVLVSVLTGETSDIVAPGALGGAAGAGNGVGQTSRFGAMGSASMGYMGLGGYMPKPLSTKLAEGQMLLAKDINTMFVTDEGMPVSKRQIPWQFAPDSIGYSYPYVLALHSPAKGMLEVRNPDTLSLLQTLSLPGASQLHVSAPSVSLAHAGKGFHISSERAVWKMDATDYDSQVETLVAQSKFDEAISVLGMLEDALLRDKTGSLREIKMRKAEALFAERRFREAIDLFNEDDVSSPPERVLRLFPPQIAGDLSGWPTEQATDEEGEPSTESSAAAAAPMQSSHGTQSNGQPEVMFSASPRPTAGGLAKLLMGRKAQPAPPSQADKSDTASILTKKDSESDDGSNMPDKSSDDGMLLHGKDLKNAVLELNGYLAGSRARLQRVLDPSTGELKPAVLEGLADHPVAGLVVAKPETAEARAELEDKLRRTFGVIDTALFRAYMFASPSLAGSLFRIPNFCDPDVVNDKLLEHSRYNELVDFFYGKKLHTQALNLLKRFGDGDDPDAPEALKGPRRTVAYLQNLPSSELDLILAHAEWTLRADADMAMEVFLADTENAETLPRDRVVAFLRGIDQRLERRYLEHIITELNDLTPDLHNRLVELYIGLLRNHHADGKKDQEDDDGRSSSSSSSSNNSSRSSKEWVGMMNRCVEFLRQSRQYSLTKAFGMIPRDDPAFYEAQAVVLSNMGQHKQALTIIVFLMHDYGKAEEYCNRIYKNEDANPTSPIKFRPDGAADPEESTPSIYHTLLSLYLSPPPPHKASLEPALDLLSKHGSRLPAASTLSLLPDTLPVRDLESYFRGRIRAANSALYETRIVAGLRATALIGAQASLHLGEGAANGQAGRNRRVIISEERLCGVCHKRLGGSVISVMPDNSVVHFGCAGRGTLGLSSNAASRLPSWGR